jgi:hypothetical protein
MKELQWLHLKPAPSQLLPPASGNKSAAYIRCNVNHQVWAEEQIVNNTLSKEEMRRYLKNRNQASKR